MLISSYALLIDTNIFNRMVVTDSEDFCNLVYNHIKEAVISNNEVLWSFTTPFLVLEALGIKIEDIKHNIALSEIQSNDPDHICIEVFNFAKNKYAEQTNLGAAYFLERYNRLHRCSSPIGKKLLEDVILPRIDQPHVDYLIQNLALDFQYGFPYKEKVKDKNDQIKIEINWMLDICRIVTEQKNLSPVRGLFEITENIKRREKNIMQSLYLFLTQKNRLKLYGDRGDLDIVHLAVMGAFLRDSHKKLLAVTADEPVQVRNRIAGYKTMVHHFLNQISAIPRLSAEYNTISMNQGKILILNPISGELREVIEVENVVIHE